jgi:hypothetical protein
LKATEEEILTKIFLIFFLLIHGAVCLAVPSVSPQGLEGKNFVGYQAWFNTPNDKMNRGWRHWGTNPLNANTMTIDMWPDTREYPAEALQNTGFLLGNGLPAQTFSSYHQSVIDLHFGWMQQFNIDGAFLQWFITEPAAYRLEITKRVQISAEKYGRQFTVMFDISGTSNSTSCNKGAELATCIKDRWKSIVDNGITSSPSYLKFKGKPLISIWGLGFIHNANLTATDAKILLDWFHFNAESKYQANVMGGVSTQWRTLDGDALSDGNWINVYASLDIISPWMVGRFTNESEASLFIQRQVPEDINLISSRGQSYLPVIFPGFSWYNLSRRNPNLPDAPLNQIPRNGGQFMWTQARELASLNLNVTYTAMFDEVDEGTAIFKTTPTLNLTPKELNLLTLNADSLTLSSDWYLKVSQNISSALKSVKLSGFESARLPLLERIEDQTVTEICSELPQTPVACSQYAGKYGIPVGATLGKASWTKNSCSGLISYTDGCSSPPCKDVAQTPVACSQYAGKYGIPIGATLGKASWTKNSCSGSINYTGGCSVPPCKDVAQTPVACSQYAGKYGIPVGATSGKASWTKNSCSGSINYTGGCF